jgi:hypothetical protein
MTMRHANLDLGIRPDTTIAPILNNTSVRETFSPSSIWLRLKAPRRDPAVLPSVALMKDRTLNLDGDDFIQPARSENDSMVGTASAGSPAVVTPFRSAQQDPSTPTLARRVTTTGPPGAERHPDVDPVVSQTVDRGAHRFHPILAGMKSVWLYGSHHSPNMRQCRHEFQSA